MFEVGSYPVTILPGWVVTAAKLIPQTYFLEYIRRFYGFEPSFSLVLAKGYIMVFAYLFMEILLMKAALGRAKRKGILLKFSE